jgi:hypothetical protein
LPRKPEERIDRDCSPERKINGGGRVEAAAAAQRGGAGFILAIQDAIQ